MKRLALAMIALATMVSTAPVQASVVATPADLSVGVALGEVGLAHPTGSHGYGNTSGDLWVEYYGSLPSMTKITFTYDIAPLTGAASAVSGYAGLSSVGSSIEDASINARAKTNVGSPDATTTDDLVTAFASLPNYSHGTASITNLSDKLISFKTTLIAMLNKYVNLTVSYQVEAVPLPAALPLFGLGLASLAGYRLRKKKMDVAA